MEYTPKTEAELNAASAIAPCGHWACYSDPQLPCGFEEGARLREAAPAMYRALKAINANEYVMLDVFSQATRQLVIEALRKAEGQ